MGYELKKNIQHGNHFKEPVPAVYDNVPVYPNPIVTIHFVMKGAVPIKWYRITWSLIL